MKGKGKGVRVLAAVLMVEGRREETLEIVRSRKMDGLEYQG
jgi:hypothetical protein